MATALSVVTAPSEMPISRDEAKAHLRVEGDDENDYIESLVKAAVYRVQAYTGQRLLEHTIDVFYTAVPTSRILTLPVHPVKSVPEVAVNGTVVADTTYTFQQVQGEGSSPSYLVLASTPTLTPGYSLRVQCVAGYAKYEVTMVGQPAVLVGTIPPGLRQAVLVMVGGMYEARQDWVQGGPPGTYATMALSEQLMDPYRLEWAF